MKKLLSSVLFATLLVVSAGQAQAALLTDWTYNLTSVSLTNANTDFVSTTYVKDPVTGENTTTIENISFNSGHYGITLDPSNESTTAGLTFGGDNSSASSDNNDKLLSQTTDDVQNVYNTPATKLADLTFSYSVASDSEPGVFMDITYTIPLYTFYDANAQTAYIYYNNSDVHTQGATAITHDGYKYGITGVGLFVDDRALVSLPGAEGDSNLYSGWAINEDTYYNDYSKYVVGGDNTGTLLGAKDVEGAFDITGVFSIANTKIETPPAPTPEPATMLLTGLGLAGMGFMKRRAKKA